MDGCLGYSSTFVKMTPHDPEVFNPYSSEFMKFPNLPKKRPMGAYKDIMSVRFKSSVWYFLEK